MYEPRAVKENEFQALKDGKKRFLACFVADWAPPCREMMPLLTQLSDELHDRLDVVTLDPDEEPLLAAGLRITSLPTLLLFKDGEECDRIVGLRTYEELARHLDDAPAD